MTALLYQNFDLRHLISLMKMDVKNLFGELREILSALLITQILKNDYTDFSLFSMHL